jgi:hypothetical protein
MNRVQNSRAGFALALVLVVLAISVTLGLAFLASASVKHTSSRNLRDAVRADYIAESGVLHGMELFRTYGLSALDANAKGPYYSDASNDGYFVSARCTDTVNHIYELTSVCSVNGVRRSRTAKVQVKSRFEERVKSLGPLWYWRLDDGASDTAVDEMGRAPGTYVRNASLGYIDGFDGGGLPGRVGPPDHAGGSRGHGRGGRGDDDDDDDDDDGPGRGRGHGRGGRGDDDDDDEEDLDASQYEAAGAILVDSDKAALFDGVDDYIDLGDVDVSGNKLTIIAWFDPGEFSSTDGRIISKADGTSPHQHDWMISYEDVGPDFRLRFRLKAGGSVKQLSPNTARLKKNTWQFVAAVYDGNRVYLYQNGEKVAQSNKSGGIATSSKSVWIGGNPDDETDRPWPGKLDEVAVFRKALTKSQIQTLYKARWPEVKVLSWLD